MTRNATVLIGWCLTAAGGGLLVHGIFISSIALIVAGVAAFADAWHRFDSPDAVRRA